MGLAEHVGAQRAQRWNGTIAQRANEQTGFVARLSTTGLLGARQTRCCVSELSITISVPEACGLLGISQSLGRQLAGKGEFPGAFKLGGRWLVHRAIFEAELERLARGERLAERDPDRILARAMGDARTRLMAIGR